MTYDPLPGWMLALAVAGGYLLGSIPFGVIITRLAGLGDVRKIGSGNIGATNVLRTGRKDLALATVLTDGGKGAVAVLVAWMLTRQMGLLAQAELTALAGGMAFLGHLFPVWLGFKGGRGVATFFGVLLAAAWPVGVASGAAWLAMAFGFRISSLAALVASAAAPLIAWGLGRPWPVVALAGFMGLLVWVRHAANIRRLLAGEEPRIGAKSA